MVASAWSKSVNEPVAPESPKALRIANEICPTSPEAVFHYVNLLLEQGRVQDALQVGANALNAAPENKQFGSLLQELRKMKAK